MIKSSSKDSKNGICLYCGGPLKPNAISGYCGAKCEKRDTKGDPHYWEAKVRAIKSRKPAP